MLARTLILRTSSLGFVERMVRNSRLFRPMVKRFVSGDKLSDALAASKDLLERGFLVSLDELGENTKTEAEAMAAKATCLEMLAAISKMPEAPGAITNGQFQAEKLNVSIKLTQFGLDRGDDVATTCYRAVVEVAAAQSNFIRVDMEASAYTERTLKIVESVWRDFPCTGTVLQAYLHRTGADVERMIELGMRVRLVKGAYLEPASVAIADKRKVDEAFVAQAKRLIEHAFYPAIATHDEKIIKELDRFVAEKGIDKRRFEFQMIYGVRRDLQDSLRKDGYNLRVYVPFGDQWYPYFTRRLAERPANVMFILKSLFKG